MVKSALNPRIPVCVRFIPAAFDPPWPPITANAPALPAVLRKSPNSATTTSPPFFALPSITTTTISPHTLSPESPRSLLSLFIDLEEIAGSPPPFRPPRRRRSRPAHRIHMQRPPNRFEQFPLRRAARPAAPELVFFLVHVFEADGFHFGHAPLFGFSFRGRSRHAGANVIAQLGEVLEGV